ELETLYKSLLWPGTVRLAASWHAELTAIAQLAPKASDYAAINHPTLLLQGTQTAQHMRLACEALHQQLPASRHVRLAGQGHNAHTLAPNLVADIIGDFLTPPPP